MVWFAKSTTAMRARDLADELTSRLAGAHDTRALAVDPETQGLVEGGRLRARRDRHDGW